MDPTVPGRSIRRWRFVPVAALVSLVAFGGLEEAAPQQGKAAATDHIQRAAAARQDSQALPQSRVASLRLRPDELRALVFLCHRGPASSGRFDLGTGHDVFGPVKEEALSPAERKVFDVQWAEAVAAARGLATPQQALAAGYVQAAPFNPGVGAHWIRWSLVGRPFDPATPSMLLFDGMPGRPVRLVGFSYWVESDKAPAGFAGPNDHWHRHAGLCFSGDGWLADQNVANAAGCKGYWLSGKNLWMLHAWVVPDLPNSWGKFAPTNPYLCPPASRDIWSCPVS